MKYKLIPLLNSGFLKSAKEDYGFCYPCGTGRENCVKLNYGSDEIELCERHFLQMCEEVERLMGWRYSKTI